STMPVRDALRPTERFMHCSRAVTTAGSMAAPNVVSTTTSKHREICRSHRTVGTPMSRSSRDRWEPLAYNVLAERAANKKNIGAWHALTLHNEIAKTAGPTAPVIEYNAHYGMIRIRDRLDPDDRGKTFSDIIVDDE